MHFKTISFAASIVSLILSGLFLVSYGNRSLDGMIIITLADIKTVNPDYLTEELRRFIPEYDLNTIDPDRPGKEIADIKEFLSDYE